MGDELDIDMLQILMDTAPDIGAVGIPGEGGTVAGGGAVARTGTA